MTCRFWTLFELIWLSVEKREFDTSPSPLSQFAPAALTFAGNHETDEPFREADASATTVTPRSVATAASAYLRMRRLLPLSITGRTTYDGDVHPFRMARS